MEPPVQAHPKKKFFLPIKRRSMGPTNLQFMSKIFFKPNQGKK